MSSSGEQHKNVWPLDSPRIWGSNGIGPKPKHRALFPLPSRLQPHCLLNFNHICRVQVWNQVCKPNSSLSRRCDSRNLNLSPFCGLDSSSAPLKLKPTVEAAYGSIDTDYVQDLQSPMRQEYPLKSMASNEILTSLVQVVVRCRFYLFKHLILCIG